MTFEFFDPKAEFSVREGGNLPHWHQQGVTYFVTFRTEDSVPRELARSWYARRDEWLRREGIDPASATWKELLASRPELERAFYQAFTSQFMQYLDRGYGACLLRRAELARIVADSFFYLDGQRYRMGDFIVMPNHVHLLACLLGDTDIESQCWSWKKFSAGKINRLLGRRGRFWQEESFDHLVRGPEQFTALQAYIAENPKKGNLRAGEFVHWIRPP